MTDEVPRPAPYLRLEIVHFYEFRTTQYVDGKVPRGDNLN